MSMFRAKKLDLGGYVNIRNIRDHTKRKVYAAHEPERYVQGYDFSYSPFPPAGT
jgi:small subunit ribosomal protein S14